MAKVIFIYNGTKFEKSKDKNKNDKDICEDFCKDSQSNINNLVFLVGENLLNLDSDSNQILGYKKDSNEPINISVFDKNCFCYTHKEPFDSYCEICKINLCNECKNKHYDHNIILYKDIIQNIIKFKKNLNELYELINKFKKEIIDDDNNIIKEIKMNLQKYYMIYSNIMNSYNNKNINYEIYNNLSNIDNMNNIIKNALNSILKENNKETKIKNIMILNNKIKKNEIHKEYRNEINLVYKCYLDYNARYLEKSLYKIIVII